PQNQNCADIIDSAEDRTEGIVSQVGEGAASRFPGRQVTLRGAKLIGRNQQRRDKAAGDQQYAHNQCGNKQQLLGVAYAPARFLLSVAGVSFDEWHYRYPSLEPRESQCEFWKDDESDQNDHCPVAADPWVGEQRVLPI